MSVRRLIPAAAAVFVLGGCSLISEPPAEQLYRFGVQQPAPSGQESRSASPTVRLGVEQGTFPREADGIRILTTEGRQVSYLAGARWASPAETQFENALFQAFQGAPVALYPRGAGGSAPALLRVDVTRFEADYVNGSAAAPVVRVQASALIVERLGRRLIGQREFAVEQPATDNRVGAVVAAYDAAVGEVTRQITAWSVETSSSEGFARASASGAR